MSVDSNKAIIREIYARLETGDRSAYADYVDPDYVWRFPSKASWSRRYEGQEEVRTKLIGPLFSLFAGTYTARLISIVGEGDIVVAEIEGHVLLKSGAIYDNQYCIMFKFRNGKIIEVIEYCDTDLEERVLGPYADALAAFEAKRGNATSTT